MLPFDGFNSHVTNFKLTSQFLGWKGWGNMKDHQQVRWAGGQDWGRESKTKPRFWPWESEDGWSQDTLDQALQPQTPLRLGNQAGKPDCKRIWLCMSVLPLYLPPAPGKSHRDIPDWILASAQLPWHGLEACAYPYLPPSVCKAPSQLRMDFARQER